jgi:glycosyltransferase involved in cell wall biosynthesis
MDFTGPMTGSKPEVIGNRIEGGSRLLKRGTQKRCHNGGPLVTIIMVVRNDADRIERTVRSVIDQSYKNIEYIVVDGASSDGTIDVLKKYQDHIDYWMSEPDMGPYDAMNKAVTLAGGDWIYFLGAGDILLNHLGRVGERLKDDRTIYYGDVYMPKLHKIYDGRYSNYKLMLKNICHQSIFYPKRVFQKYCFDTRYRIWADYVLNVKCHRDADFRFAYLPILIAIFDDYEGISCNKSDTEVERERKELVRANFSKTLYWLFCMRFAAVKAVERLGLKENLRSLVKKSAG